MNIDIHETTGILLNSSVNLFNYNSANPGEWYNHTFTHHLIDYEIFVPRDIPPDSPLLAIIILIISIVAGSIAGIMLYLKYHEKEIDISAIKHNPKHNPQIKKPKRN